MSIGSFVAGFVSGWLVRSTVDSSRDLAVNVVSGYHDIVRRVRRAFVAEREFFEDLWAEAEARAKAEEEEWAESPTAHERRPHANGEIAP